MESSSMPLRRTRMINNWRNMTRLHSLYSPPSLVKPKWLRHGKSPNQQMSITLNMTGFFVSFVLFCQKNACHVDATHITVAKESTPTHILMLKNTHIHLLAPSLPEISGMHLYSLVQKNLFCRKRQNVQPKMNPHFHVNIQIQIQNTKMFIQCHFDQLKHQLKVIA